MMKQACNSDSKVVKQMLRLTGEDNYSPHCLGGGRWWWWLVLLGVWEFPPQANPGCKVVNPSPPPAPGSALYRESSKKSPRGKISLQTFIDHQYVHPGSNPSVPIAYCDCSQPTYTLTNLVIKVLLVMVLLLEVVVVFNAHGAWQSHIYTMYPTLYVSHIHQTIALLHPVSTS